MTSRIVLTRRQRERSRASQSSECIVLSLCHSSSECLVLRLWNVLERIVGWAKVPNGLPLEVAEHSSLAEGASLIAVKSQKLGSRLKKRSALSESTC
jgi:hypothetical protein